MGESQENLTVNEVFERIVTQSLNKREQGTAWERAVKFYFENDPTYQDKFSHVWMWEDAPTNPGRQDTGIDLVAQDATTGEYWAIQAKCYTSKTLSEGDVSTFFMNATEDTYAYRVLVDTAPKLTRNLEEFICTHESVYRIGLDVIKKSNLPWQDFWTHGMHLTCEEVQGARKRLIFDPLPHQRKAINAVKAELQEADRTTLVMACGTGKTLTALRFSEEFVPGGTVLFLAPSISLVAQSMRDWAQQVRGKLRVWVVCSDPKASKLGKDKQDETEALESYGSLSQVPYPATTNPKLLEGQFAPDPDALNVIFSTYQSIDVIHRAQELGLPVFDLIICDEAHRTTGRMHGESGREDETSFVRVHDNQWIAAVKRLYMTATPRVYETRDETLPGTKKVSDGLIASMNNPEVYGRICHRLSFGAAVDQGLLTDYKLVVMQIDQSMLPQSILLYAMSNANEIDVPDAARFLGVWKALFDRTHAGGVMDLEGADSGQDDAQRVLHHAIAFAANISASKLLSNEFQHVVDAYLQGTEPALALPADARHVRIDVKHVDGTMTAPQRAELLDWLAEKDDEDTCHVLSNARCLAEGIDVPDLDAVIYLSKRRSKVDIIQSVGRVMRTSPGKKYGYIIIPIFVPEGTDPGTALSSSREYGRIWDVVSALRSHDERLNAKINSASLGDSEPLKKVVEFEVLDSSRLNKAKNIPHRTHPIGEDAHDEDREPSGSHDQGDSGQSQLILGDNDESLQKMARAIRAQIVRKCGTKIYWSEWSSDVGAVTRARAEQIRSLVAAPGRAADAFGEFLTGLRDTLNPDYEADHAVDVLAQHEVTRPIFDALFNQDQVREGNPIVAGIERALAALYDAGLESSLDSPELTDLYSQVRVIASQVQSDTAKQNLIKELYNDFFAAAFKDTADELGIVYTPVEVVDAQLHMVQRALQREFGESLGDRGVHILDGFAGTGTYLSRLIEDPTLIPDDDLPYKYDHDLHSNEIVPLAATIMDINIEQSYHARMGGAYRPFLGALLCDTFQLGEEDNVIDRRTFLENSDRIEEQVATDITVIVGNPPYRAGDKGNTGNQNAKYRTLDGRIESTYAARTTATLKNSLYDHYIRAFRWASDRIGDSGIVCFVSNGGWLKGDAAAGVRRCFCEEFNSIYVYNLRGNQRTQGEESRREGGKIFDSGSRATVAITLLAKNPASNERGVIRYCDIGDYLSRQEKLDILKDAVDADPEWTVLTPDRHGDWLDQRDDSWYEFAPMGLTKQKTPLGIFNLWSQAVLTARDAWAFSFDRGEVVGNMERLIATFNEETRRFQEAGRPGDVKRFVTDDGARIKWTRELYSSASLGRFGTFDESHLYPSLYRPFCKQWLYMDSQFNNCVYLQPRLFPSPEVENLEICMVGPSAGREFSCLLTNINPDHHMQSTAQCFPLYWYDEPSSDGLLGNAEPVRHDTITDEALAVFHEAYGDSSITKEDVFFYVYGVLHSREYRTRFANNLKKELPRIPLAADFRAFEEAGRKLGELHVNYESVEPWPVEEVGSSENPGRTEKMAWGKVRDKETGKLVKDFTVLKVSDSLTLRGIPERAQEYVVNGKSALGWLVDRYKVTTDKKSGIVNDPNLYAPDNPRYIVDLVESVITVSLETLDIVDSLPPLNELPHPANWPTAWSMDVK
ncbi:DNA damage-inducible protein [Atopobiaceae bacterium P1]|uniref:DNA damage-inducible protein n=1 Tax=Leptogranulimonas caecicola TaxID=2894156 RepID=A0AAU9CK44_9ACTN|nr:type ISP restriction/modification enzyme [Leptogranulimonas caecicola]BCV18466.1 DNA damage-inducible protein [Atopobiaceae bacterium P1]BDC90813.1 DNA damage-inducible protein [Leptogranulimonas caecicola]